VVDLAKLPVETDESLQGSGALIFRVLGDRPEEPTTTGAIHAVGHITSLRKRGPVFRWTIPGPSSATTGGGITTENFDQRIHDGTELAITFRQPLALKSRFIRSDARVVGVVKDVDEGGTEEATITLEYTSIDPELREILDRHVEQLETLRC
jgi:hypothetical protein